MVRVLMDDFGEEKRKFDVDPGVDRSVVGGMWWRWRWRFRASFGCGRGFGWMSGGRWPWRNRNRKDEDQIRGSGYDLGS